MLGVSGNQRRSLGREVVGGDALQTRDLQSEAHRAQAGRRQSLQDMKAVLKERRGLLAATRGQHNTPHVEGTVHMSDS